MNQPLAYVHPQAKLASTVVVEPFVFIDKNVEIGEGTWIGSNVTIMEGARIGKNNKIFPGAVISAVPQDLKFDNEESIVRIGDNNIIREFVTVNRGTIANMETTIGDNNLIMAYVHVAHDCIVGNNCILANATTLAGHITVEDFAIVGGMVAVHQFVNIGAHSMISGGSLVRKDVPPFAKAGREPVSYVGINSIGLRRRGFTSAKINEIQSIFRILFQKKNNVSQAVRVIEAEMPASPERDEIISFILNSKRGIMRGYNNK
ncbi:MAG: acyl-[acyl-carrier-protein]--UDP-N-acetylglucosamine O-acyltransferase [Bacteroidetes bacterium]|nr:MAG: acyl-[acyl-carrier-protein]--UDP-N-acetylglucosamine O-acyltransferase [Bacteroidota bacterium]